MGVYKWPVCWWKLTDKQKVKTLITKSLSPLFHHSHLNCFVFSSEFWGENYNSHLQLELDFDLQASFLFSKVSYFNCRKWLCFCSYLFQILIVFLTTVSKSAFKSEHIQKVGYLTGKSAFMSVVCYLGRLFHEIIENSSYIWENTQKSWFVSNKPFFGCAQI